MTECYCITVTFMDSFANSKQGKWKFWNASSISMPCFGHRTDIWVVQVLSLALLQTCWPCHSVSLSECLFFHEISFKKNNLPILLVHFCTFSERHQCNIITAYFVTHFKKYIAMAVRHCLASPAQTSSPKNSGVRAQESSKLLLLYSENAIR